MQQNGLNPENTFLALPPQSTPQRPHCVDDTSSTIVSGLTDTFCVSSTSPGRSAPLNVTADHGVPRTPPCQGPIAISESHNDEGYDSDGMQGPFFDAVEGEAQLEGEDEEEVGASNLPQLTQAAQQKNQAIVLANEIIERMRVKQLQEELKRRACSLKGKKKELQDRLKEAVQKNMPLVEDIDSEAMGNLAGEGFALAAK